MQLGGVDNRHGSDSHQVTNCLHDHTHIKKEPGGAAMSSDMSAKTFQMQQQQQDAGFSLSEWMQKTLESGRRFLKGIWGNQMMSSAAQTGDKSGQEQIMAQLGDARLTGQGEKPAGMRQPEINPYFQTVQSSNSAAPANTFLRVRAKVRGVAGQLAGKLPGRFLRFQTKNSFQAKSEQKPEEDLRKRSKYRKDELEIDCILTDESYLLDSYDRKGEYSQLSAKK